MQQHIVTVAGPIGYQPFEQAGIDRFIGLLDILEAHNNAMRSHNEWTKLLLDVIQPPRKIQYLSHSYWEQLAEFVTSWQFRGADGITYNPCTIESLEGNGEWDKLKCWLCIVWVVWPPEGDQTTEENLEHTMLSLSHHIPGTIQELEEQLNKCLLEFNKE